MKQKGFRLLLIVGSLLICPFVSHAEDQTTGLQVSLYHPLQLHSKDCSVDGLRLDFIYGINKDVQGVDIGIVNETQGHGHGFELGLVNVVRRDFEGLQVAVFYNETQEEMRGLQLGIVNHTGSLKGIQIGILNFNDETKYLGFFPFINASF